MYIVEVLLCHNESGLTVFLWQHLYGCICMYVCMYMVVVVVVVVVP